MARYRKKPVVVDAVRWHGPGDHGLVKPWSRKVLIPCPGCHQPMNAHGMIDTLEGDGHIVCPGDWIIRGVMGEHYPCKNDIFEATYEAYDA